MSSALFKNTAIYGMGSIVQKLFSFLLVFLYTHYLTTTDIGVINTLQVFSAIYILFLSFGLERSLYRLYHDYKTTEEKKIFLGTINISILLIGSVIVGLTFLLKNQISLLFKGDIPFYPFIILAISDSFFNVLTIVPKLIFQIRGEAVKYLSITLGQAIVSLICILTILFLGKRTVYWVMLGNIIGYIIFLPIYIKVAINNMSFVLNVKILKNTLKYSLPIVPSLLSSWVINMSDRVFIEIYYGMPSVGLYSVVYKIGQVVQLFSVALLMAYNPMFFQMANSPNLDRGKLNKLHNQNILVLAVLCFSVALISNDVIAIFLPPTYLTVAHIVPAIVGGYFFIALTGLQNLSFYQDKNTLALMLVSIISAGINILFNFILIRPYGIDGAAIATVLTQAIFFIITYILSLRFFALPINLKVVLSFMAGAAIMLVVFYNYVKPGWIGFAIKVLIISILVSVFLKKQLVNLIKKNKNSF